MADRFPLILNTSANQIQEIASGDILDLSGVSVKNAGIITATTFSGSAASLTGIANANVASNAAIAGTKITPNFGSQTINSDNGAFLGGNLSISNVAPKIFLTDTDNDSDFAIRNMHGVFGIHDQTNSVNRLTIASNGNVSVSKDLDVDGHTNLDNVNVVGVVTVTGAVNASHSTFGNLQTTGITIQNTNATINFTDTNNNPDYRVKADGGTFDVVQWNTGGSDINVVKINTDGHIDIGTNVDFAAGIDVTGNITATGNVSIGGTLTYEDVTNIDSVGIVTARDGVFIPDNKELKIGNTAASPDLKIYHDTSDTVIHQDGTGDLRIRSDNSIEFNTNGTQNAIWCDPGAAVKLYYNNELKLKTTDTGIDVTGQVVADSASFTDDGSSSPTVKIFTDDANPYALNIGNSSYNASAPFGQNFFNNNSGEGYFRHIGNGTYKDYHFSLHDNSTNKLVLKFEADDQSVELYGRGSKDLETTGTGVVVSGVCTATSFTGDLTGNVTGTASGNATISSNANNRIITGGSGNALTGESELTYSTYLNLTRSNTDTNFGDNSAPGGVNGIFVSNSSSTNGVFSAITLSANDVNGTNQSASLVAKSVGGGYVPEVHITQRTGNNTNESNIKITNTRSVELRHEGNTRLQTSAEGVKIGRTMFTGSTTNVENEALVIAPSINTGNLYHDNHVVSIGQLSGNWSQGASGDDTAFGLMFSYASGTNGAKLLRGGIVYDHKSTEELQIWSSYGSIAFYQDLANGGNETPVTCDTKCAEFDSGGHFVPGDNNRDLGTSSAAWRNLYTQDLNLSNEVKGGNDVDGTWGSYTIQEGENDLFLINKRSGKKYKFNLTEVT